MSGPDHPPRRRRRRLTADDRAVWDEIARSAAPLHAPAPIVVTAPTPAPVVAPRLPPRLAPTRVVRPQPPGPPGQITISLADHAPAPVGRPEAGLDKRTAERLRGGERAPDARLDLHGLTADVAHRALERFIAEAVTRQLRCVLVITGKGGRGRQADDAPYMRPDQGVLRQAAPRWLRSGPHARDLVGIYEAHQRHGGAGAFYVYLKRRR